MKEYIFVAFHPGRLGGGEFYVNGKVKFLEENGWVVHTFFSGTPDDETIFPHMEAHMRDAMPGDMLAKPPYRRMKWEQEYILDYMCSHLTTTNGDVDEIIVESVEDIVSYWAELLAARIHGRHIFVACNEYFRDSYQTYEENLDFFYFKWKRKELFTSAAGIQMLFKNYKKISEPLGRIPTYCCPEPNPVQNVKNTKVDTLQTYDWNICHLGRPEKIYVPDVVEGIVSLAKAYPEKEIQFILLGDAELQRKDIEKKFCAIKNVHLEFLGFLCPIPKSLFKKIDVVIAISQSARFAAQQGVPTIVACNHKAGTSGVLGIDTMRDIPAPKDHIVSYKSVLERVLVQGEYRDKCHRLMKEESIDDYYEEFIQVAREASPVKEYYVQKLSQERLKGKVYLFPYSRVRVNSKVVIYGAGNVGRDFKKQILIGRYCELIGVVDTNYTEYDESVLPVLKLKEWDYDYIVIAVENKEIATEIVGNIVTIVPDAKDKIIYQIDSFFLK